VKKKVGVNINKFCEKSNKGAKVLSTRKDSYSVCVKGGAVYKEGEGLIVSRALATLKGVTDEERKPLRGKREKMVYGVTFGSRFIKRFRSAV